MFSFVKWVAFVQLSWSDSAHHRRSGGGVRAARWIRCVWWRFVMLEHCRKLILFANNWHSDEHLITYTSSAAEACARRRGWFRRGWFRRGWRRRQTCIHQMDEIGNANESKSMAIGMLVAPNGTATHSDYAADISSSQFRVDAANERGLSLRSPESCPSRDSSQWWAEFERSFRCF